MFYHHPVTTGAKMSEDNEHIPKDVHDSIVNEKDVISAISQNLWAVDFTESLYELHGHWVDDISDEDIDEITAPIQGVMDELHTESGYDADRIRSMDESEQEQIVNTLDRNTTRAANYFEQIHQRVQGQQDTRRLLENQLPDLINQSVQNTFQTLVDEGDLNFTGGDVDVSVTTEVDDETLNQVYNVVENSIEANLEGTVDQETMDDIYDQLEGLEDAIYDQARQTRGHVSNEHDATRDYVGDQHQNTRDHTTSEHEHTRSEMHGRFDDIEDKLDEDDDNGYTIPEISRRKLGGVLAALAGGYLIFEQLHDGDELTNITWDDADNGNGGQQPPTDTSSDGIGELRSGYSQDLPQNCGADWTQVTQDITDEGYVGGEYFPDGTIDTEEVSFRQDGDRLYVAAWDHNEGEWEDILRYGGEC